jgi:hypothetical protein
VVAAERADIGVCNCEGRPFGDEAEGSEKADRHMESPTQVEGRYTPLLPVAGKLGPAGRPERSSGVAVGTGVDVGEVDVCDGNGHCDLGLEDGEMGEAAREGRSKMVLRNWKKGSIVLGRRFSRRVADTVRHRDGSVVVRRTKAETKKKRIRKCENHLGEWVHTNCVLFVPHFPPRPHFFFFFFFFLGLALRHRG